MDRAALQAHARFTAGTDAVSHTFAPDFFTARLARPRSLPCILFGHGFPFLHVFRLRQYRPFATR
jgi:hypothetical protein